MRRPDWAPPEVDITTPSIARVYDYYLGGSHNFAADREAARRTLEVLPDARHVWDVRDFLRRAVEFLVREGIAQFLDIGSGIPTAGNVHQVAQELDPDARVVYVDIDPVAVAHSQAILRHDTGATAIQADIREPERILGHPDTRRLLDFDRPVAVLMCAVLHFVPDSDDPRGLIRRYRGDLASGSFLAITHGTVDDPESTKRLTGHVATYNSAVAGLTPRCRAEMVALFDGFELVDPGVDWVARWRPEPDATPSDLLTAYGGVGRKP